MSLVFDRIYGDRGSLVSGKQAQQTHRFVLRVKGIDAAIVQNVTAPKYTVKTTEYNMLDYKFKYPTKAEWNGTVTFELVQIIDQDTITSTLGYLMSKLYDSGYYSSPMGVGAGQRDSILPNSLYSVRSNISTFLNNGPNVGYVRNSSEGTVLDFSKQKLKSALGRVEIITLDEDGKVYESWRLNESFITAITPTDLNYNSETLSTIKVELSYDWADYGYRGVYAEEDAVSRILGI